jgi:Holliday junction resolvase
LGKPSRDKGARVERNIVNRLRDRGIEARRVPLSGATDWQKGDVQLWTPDGPWIGEVKGRKQFPAWLVEWLGDNHCLFLVADRQEPLVVLRMDRLEELLLKPAKQSVRDDLARLVCKHKDALARLADK